MCDLLQLRCFMLHVSMYNMTQQTQDTKKSQMSGEARLVETLEQVQSHVEEKTIPDKLILEFISRHHLGHLWEEFVYEKEHPNTPLSASEVLAMIDMPPEEQDKIIKAHEEY